MNLKTILLLLFYTCYVNSQELDLTEIEKQLDTTTLKETKVELLLKLGSHFRGSDSEKSEKYFNQAFTITTNKDSSQKAYIYYNLGLIYNSKGDYTKSFSNLMKAKNIYGELKDTLHQAEVLFSTGVLYRGIKDFDKEIKSYKEAFFLADQINANTLKARCYNLFGGYYRRKKKLDSSLIYFKKAINTFNKINYTGKFLNATYNNMSILYEDKKEYDKSVKLRLEVIKNHKENNFQNGLAVAYLNTSISYINLRDFKTSLNYLDSSITIAKREKLKPTLSNCYKTKSYIYNEEANYKEAYKNYVLYDKISDSIFDLKKHKKIKELELKNTFNLEKKELEIVNQKKEARKQLFIIILISILILGFIISFFVWKHKQAIIKIGKEKLEKEKLKKEILTQKIKASESELKSIIADNTMRLEFIKQLSKQLSIDKNSNTSKEVKNYTNGLILKLQQQISTENKFSSLQQKIKDINQGFDEKLISLFPKLTKTEREICSFLRLNLSIKEIASIRNSSNDSIKAVRYRIRKKMEIPKTQELEFFIQNLFI